MIESDAGRVEIGVDLAPGFDDFGRTNLYLAATGAYVGFIGDGTLYWKAGGGALLETQDGTSYFLGIIDVGPAMLGEYGTPKLEIWRNDKLPMSDAGYAIWIPITKKALSTSR